MLSMCMLRRDRQRKSGNPVFSSTKKIPQSLTLVPKSVGRTPESCGAHAIWARAVVSILQMFCVIFLEEMHLWEVCMHLMAYHWWPRQKSRGREFAKAIAQCRWRIASSDRIILPRSSVSEVLGIKTVLFLPKHSGTLLPIRHDTHERKTSNQGHQNIWRHRKEFRQVQEPSLS